jgi:hypothetical protein
MKRTKLCEDTRRGTEVDKYEERERERKRERILIDKFCGLRKIVGSFN